MENILLFVITLVVACWSIPKPMESITNYNVVMVHGAYESSKGIAESNGYVEAYNDSSFLGDAYLGKYDGNDRIVKWLSNKVFGEPILVRRAAL